MIKDDPNYSLYEEGNHLYLNLIDPKWELSALRTNHIIEHAIHFIDRQIIRRPVLVHCDQGQSRSTMVAMTYLANKDIITRESYAAAVIEFIKRYPDFKPGNGVKAYCQNNWEFLSSILKRTK